MENLVLHHITILMENLALLRITFLLNTYTRTVQPFPGSTILQDRMEPVQVRLYQNAYLGSDILHAIFCVLSNIAENFNELL